MDFLNEEINRVTEEKLGNMFAEAESVADIQMGLSENYALSETRANLIADTEFHSLQNEVIVRMAEKTDKVVGVWVTDGVLYDQACIDANESVWSLEYAQTHQLEHPRCHRLLHPINQEFLDEYGGFDEE
jgi:hypothetical protein